MLDLEELDIICEDIEKYFEGITKQVFKAVEESREIAERCQYHNLNYNMNQIIDGYNQMFLHENLGESIEAFFNSDSSFKKISESLNAGEHAILRSQKMEDNVREIIFERANNQIQHLPVNQNGNPQVSDDVYSQIRDIFGKCKNDVNDEKRVDVSDNVLDEGAVALEAVLGAAVDSFFQAAETVLEHLDEDLRTSEHQEKSRDVGVSQPQFNPKKAKSGLLGEAGGGSASGFAKAAASPKDSPGPAFRKEAKEWIELAKKMLKCPEEPKLIQEFYEKLWSVVESGKIRLLDEKRLIENAIGFWREIPRAYIIKTGIEFISADSMEQALNPKETQQKKGELLKEYPQVLSNGFWPIPPKVSSKQEAFPCQEPVSQLALGICNIFAPGKYVDVKRDPIYKKKHKELFAYADQMVNGSDPWKGVSGLFECLFMAGTPRNEPNKERQWYIWLCSLIKSGMDSGILILRPEALNEADIEPEYARSHLVPVWKQCSDWEFGEPLNWYDKTLENIEFAKTHYTIPDVEFGYMKGLVAALVERCKLVGEDAGREWRSRLADEVVKITGGQLFDKKKLEERLLNNPQEQEKLVSGMCEIGEIVENSEFDPANPPFKEIRKQYGKKKDKKSSDTKTNRNSSTKNNGQLMQLMKALAAQPFNYMEYEEIRFAIDDWRQNNKWLPKKIHKYLAASSEVIGFITPTANYQINIVGNFNMRTSMGIKGAKGFIGFLKDVFTHNLIKSPCISRLTPIQKVHINLALKSLEKMYDVDPESNSEWKWRTVYNGIMGLDYLSYRWREDKLYGNPINSKLKNNIDYPFIRAHQEGDLPKEILYSFETACSYLAYVNPGRNNMLKLWKGSDKVGKVKALLQFAYFSVAGCMLGDKPKSMTPADGKKLLDVLLKYQREQLKVIGISEPYLEEIEKLKEELSNLNEMEIHRIKMADVIR